MAKGLEALASLNYPGRIVIFGKDLDGLQLNGYAPTVRSEPNQQRLIIFYKDTHQLKMDPINPKDLQRPDANLVFYPIMRFTHAGVAMSNGAHTANIEDELREKHDYPIPGKILEDAFAILLPEPDKLGTPRIGGCAARDRIGFAIVRKRGELIERAVYDFQNLEPGQCFFMRTYDGTNAVMDEPQAYLGGPEEIRLTGKNPRENCFQIIDALNPKLGEKDLRVAVAVVNSTIPSSEIKEPRREGYVVNWVAREEYPIGEF